MHFRISNDDGTPIYQQVINQIRLLIASGRLSQGEQLPTVRGLAEQLLVNPNTIARAYRELEAAGDVTSRRGAGVFVAAPGSPLSRRARNQILNDRIDGLLAEAHQLGVDVETVVQLVRRRGDTFLKGGK